jgi:hypothetical protein
MARNTKPDILEWTVTEAPDPSEIESLAPPVWEPAPTPPELDAYTPEAHSPSHHFQISRRMWLILGTAIVGLVLGAGLYTLWNRYRIRGEIERFVAAEEQAALAGDTQKIKQLTDNGDPSWWVDHAMLAEGNQAAPVPMSILWGLPEAGIAQSIHSIASDAVQVDVSRKFMTPDGNVVTFALPQFYHYANGGWKRIAPPKTIEGEKKTRPGLRVSVTYDAVDEEVVVGLSDYLDGVLAQACAAWACPDDLKLQVEFMTTAASPNSFYYSPFSQDPLLASLIGLEPLVIFGGSTLILASPHAVGYPADAAGTDLFKRVLAVELLAKTAHAIAPDSSNNEFLYALVERMAVRLKLEPPKVAEMYFPNPQFTAEDLWGNNQQGTPTSPLGDGRLRGALALLNRLLRDSPPDWDIALFNHLNSASDPAAWLSAGMDIPLSKARERLREQYEGTYPLHVLATDPHEFTLACQDGPAVISRGDAQPTRLLAEYLSESYPMGWSPDGKRLAMTLSGQWAAVDFESGTVLSPPHPSPSPSFNVLGWASDTVIAYQMWSQSTNSSASDPILTFYDFADPQREFPELSGIQQYILSPDKSHAAVILPHKNGQIWSHGQLALIPALGGPLTLLDDDASSPTWSPKGDALAYVHFALDAVSLYVADPITGISREVWSSQESGLPSESEDFGIRWSPTGGLIALTSNISGTESWIFLTRPDGSNARILAQPEENAASYPSGFSSDGKYFAVIHLGPRSWILSTTLIYETATGALIRTLPNMLGWTPWSSPWSPTGHELMLNSYNGVYLLAEPGNLKSRLEKLTGERCFALMWNPRP